MEAKNTRLNYELGVADYPGKQALVARIQRLEAALREIDEGAECPGYVNGEEIVPWFVQIARKALSTKDTE